MKTSFYHGTSKPFMGIASSHWSTNHIPSSIACSSTWTLGKSTVPVSLKLSGRCHSYVSRNAETSI